MLLIRAPGAVARRTMPLRSPSQSRRHGFERPFFSASTSFSPASTASKPPFRVYRYVVDVHGQLFIHDTVPKNLTSCFKNTEFLDFFFKRIRPNPESLTASPHYARSGAILRHDILNPPTDTTLPPDWSDVRPYNGWMPSSEQLHLQACTNGNSEGYEWISPCGPELNLVRCQDTPIVYRELVDDGGDTGMLKWAGDLWEPFQPEKLVVDPSNGYVYHPSPKPSHRRSTRSSKEGEGEDEQRYGSLSLLGSNLVLSTLAEGLEIDPDAFEKGSGGSIEWKGERFQLGLLGRT
ncbi:hypothetical protein PHSY_005686 [Pseudozyma hubeiensis SY62]|uniref:Uncharacterized protein n=1 Tax=Pseudozyma hubeiensis (strain SY62) TaxID=1305764 RepID=R9PA15_PSEHS|nr:hypothetical protein PHSY_005686 [Pseudozyma hubeiensis SY62]GAC98097.1 hypothetical protein PHSY_005686 [Pseudozyma hubeiensis SY62]